MLKILKNKYLVWMVMQIIIYFIKKNDLILQKIHEDMGSAAIWVGICAVVGLVSIIIGYKTFGINLKEVAKMDPDVVKFEEMINNEYIYVKPLEFTKLYDSANVTYSLVNSSWTGIMGIVTFSLVVSILYGIISFEDYMEFVKWHRRVNGIANDGKMPVIKEWYENGNN